MCSRDVDRDTGGRVCGLDQINTTHKYNDDQQLSIFILQALSQQEYIMTNNNHYMCDITNVTGNHNSFRPITVISKARSFLARVQAQGATINHNIPRRLLRRTLRLRATQPDKPGPL
jgi:hypothetical protein